MRQRGWQSWVGLGDAAADARWELYPYYIAMDRGCDCIQEIKAVNYDTPQRSGHSTSTQTPSTAIACALVLAPAHVMALPTSLFLAAVDIDDREASHALETCKRAAIGR